MNQTRNKQEAGSNQSNSVMGSSGLYSREEEMREK
jgi:hypothetical protein